MKRHVIVLHGTTTRSNSTSESRRAFETLHSAFLRSSMMTAPARFAFVPFDPVDENSMFDVDGFWKVEDGLERIFLDPDGAAANLRDNDGGDNGSRIVTSDDVADQLNLLFDGLGVPELELQNSESGSLVGKTIAPSPLPSCVDLDVIWMAQTTECDLLTCDARSSRWSIGNVTDPSSLRLYGSLRRLSRESGARVHIWCPSMKEEESASMSHRNKTASVLQEWSNALECSYVRTTPKDETGLLKSILDGHPPPWSVPSSPSSDFSKSSMTLRKSKDWMSCLDQFMSDRETAEEGATIDDVLAFLENCVDGTAMKIDNPTSANSITSSRFGSSQLPNRLLSAYTSCFSNACSPTKSEGSSSTLEDEVCTEFSVTPKRENRSRKNIKKRLPLPKTETIKRIRKPSILSQQPLPTNSNTNTILSYQNRPRKKIRSSSLERSLPNSHQPPPPYPRFPTTSSSSRIVNPKHKPSLLSSYSNNDKKTYKNTTGYTSRWNRGASLVAASKAPSVSSSLKIPTPMTTVPKVPFKTGNNTLGFEKTVLAFTRNDTDVSSISSGSIAGPQRFTSNTAPSAKNESHVLKQLHAALVDEIRNECYSSLKKQERMEDLEIYQNVTEMCTNMLAARLGGGLEKPVKDEALRKLVSTTVAQVKAMSML